MIPGYTPASVQVNLTPEKIEKLRRVWDEESRRSSAIFQAGDEKMSFPSVDNHAYVGATHPAQPSREPPALDVICRRLEERGTELRITLEILEEVQSRVLGCLRTGEVAKLNKPPVGGMVNTIHEHLDGLEAIEARLREVASNLNTL